MLPPSVINVTIANGQTTSNSVDVRLNQVVALSMPAGWTAADITVEVSDDSSGSVWRGVTNGVDGAAYTFKVAAGMWVRLPGGTVWDLFGAHLIRLVSTAAQGADRVIGLVVRPTD